MHRIVQVKPLKNYRLWLKFSDGVEGNVDLSHLAGKGVFAAWKDAKFFKSVFIDPESQTVAWEGGIDLCPDTSYAEILGVDHLSTLRQEVARASKEWYTSMTQSI
ncbi:MAG: DUF2442 domain-containing protein [Chloroflexi bacterium]|nr:DUF2442 domain-containing protein [Chloroflexota bacterium]